MSGAVGSGFRAAYDLAFQVSPIILQGGLAASSQGGLLPIIALTGQVASLIEGIAGSGAISVNDFFAQYLPLPGSTLIANAAGMYPFANQQVAANAIIEQPLTLSMLMIAPVNQAGGYITKLPVFTAMRSSLRSHNNAGGTYAVATPAFIFTDLIMTGMTDVTSGESPQVQTQWQIDFIKPLISLSQAAAAESSLIAKVTGGNSFTGTPSWSGPGVAVGSAVQGAASGLSGLTGAVGQFLAS